MNKEGIDMNKQTDNLKKLIYLMVVVFVILLISIHIYGTLNQTSGNKDSNTGRVESKTKIVLDYYIWQDEESYILPVTEAYNALQSSVTVCLHVIDSNKYDKEIKVLLEQDRKIDLLNTRGISSLIQLQDEGRLLDITEYIKNSDTEVTAYGSMFNEIALSNRYYGMPTRSTSWILVYNKDIFDAAGVDYPIQLTWDEYRQLAISLTSQEDENKIYGGYWVPWCYNFGAILQNSYLIDDDLSYARESLEFLNNCYNVDGSHMSYSYITEAAIDYRQEFESGKIAMMPQGEWIVNMLLTDEKKGLTDVNWDIAPIPVMESQEADVTWGQYQFAAITAKTDYPEEAFEFMQFLCGEEGAKIYAEYGIIHAYTNEEIKEIYLKTVGKSSASIFFDTKKIQEQLAISGYQEILETFNQCAQEYFLGNKTLDETMQDFEIKRSKILAK